MNVFTNMCGFGMPGKSLCQIVRLSAISESNVVLACQFHVFSHDALGMEHSWFWHNFFLSVRGHC
jgi:hypothetical protein